MLGDKINDGGVQPVLFRELDTFDDMIRNDQPAHGGLDVIVLVIPEHLVFRKIFGLDQFSDIMIISAHAGQKRVGADGIRRAFGEVADDQTVMIRPRRFQDQPL